jgi:hypothetical protein
LHQKTRSAPGLVYRAFNSAYQAGSARGAKWLAKCYRNGWGTQINPEKADELAAEARDMAQRDEIIRLSSMVWSQKADPPAEKACPRWSWGVKVIIVVIVLFPIGRVIWVAYVYSD